MRAIRLVLFLLIILAAARTSHAVVSDPSELVENSRVATTFFRSITAPDQVLGQWPSTSVAAAAGATTATPVAASPWQSAVNQVKGLWQQLVSTATTTTTTTTPSTAPIVAIAPTPVGTPTPIPADASNPKQDAESLRSARKSLHSSGPTV